MVKIKKYLVLLILLLITLQAVSAEPIKINSIPYVNINMEDEDVMAYAGAKLVLFFKTTCEVCHEQIEVYKQIEEQYSNLEIFLLEANMKQNNETLVTFANETDIPDTWQLGYSYFSNIETFDIQVVPHTLIIDKNDLLVISISGYSNYAFLDKYLQIALNEEVDKYETKQKEDTSDLTTAIVIIVGVLLLVALVFSFFSSAKKADSAAKLYMLVQQQSKETKQKQEAKQGEQKGS